MVVGWWQRRNTKKVLKVRMMSDCFIDGETKHFPGFFLFFFLCLFKNKIVEEDFISE